MPVKLSKLVRWCDQRYPFALAEEWDNVGLIVGDPSAQVSGVLLALDFTLDVVEEAASRSCQAVIVHHPPIFRAIKRIDASSVQGAILSRALRDGISCIALHTNLDSARGGLNDVVCDMLGLTKVKPLMDSGRERLYKLVVFTPEADTRKVLDAMFEAGAGAIGNYDRCSFNLGGVGTFRGGEDTNPTIGVPGSFQQVQEFRSEVLIRREQFGEVYSAMLKAHPYEEVAYDLIPLHNREKDTGLGRIGVLPEAMSLRAFCDKLSALGMMVLRFVGDPERSVRKVGLCTGAGSDFSTSAASQGADVYLSAEIKHHHALEADARGTAIVETDHWTLETLVWSRVANELNAAFAGREGDSNQLEAMVSERERNHWTRYP